MNILFCSSKCLNIKMANFHHPLQALVWKALLPLRHGENAFCFTKLKVDRVPGTRRNYISGYWVSYKRFQMDMNTRDKICSNISSAKKPAVIPKWWSNLWDRCSPRRHSRLYQARKRRIFPKTDSVIYHTFCYTFTRCQDRSKYPYKKSCRRSLIRIPED